MALLARTTKTKPKTAPAPVSPAAPPVALAVEGVGLQWRLANVSVTALPEGALWIESARTLIVSDLHLEKGSAFAKRGQMLPPYDTRTTLKRIHALVDTLAPTTLVSLGDSFHDVGGPKRMDGDDLAHLRTLTSCCDWIWILGNHDPEVPANLGGVMKSEIRIGALTLRHEPQPTAEAGEIAGHLHPCAKVVGRGVSVRRRCFATDGARLVMPAFGAYTGGLNVRDDAFAPLFPAGVTALVMARKRVLPAAHHRLIHD